MGRIAPDVVVPKGIASATSVLTHPATVVVAVIIPALNEAGKIGRVLDKMPSDGRFEAIVIDDGSTDGTGAEALAHGAAVVVRHEERGGVGAAIRDGWRVGVERERPWLALLSGDDQHEPAELVRALDEAIASQAGVFKSLGIELDGAVKVAQRDMRIPEIAQHIAGAREIAELAKDRQRLLLELNCPLALAEGLIRYAQVH